MNCVYCSTFVSKNGAAQGVLASDASVMYHVSAELLQYGESCAPQSASLGLDRMVCNTRKAITIDCMATSKSTGTVQL